MRIFVFTRHYPVPYKPYYDTQFADLIRTGHDITIWAENGLDQVLNEKVRRFELAARTRSYPTTVRTLPRFLGRIARAVISHPLWSLREARALAPVSGSTKRLLMNWARTILLGRSAPDMCIVHGMGTAVMFPFLRRIYAQTPVALYYHGGETPGVAELQNHQTAEAFRSVDVVFSNTRFSCQHAIDRGCPADRIEIMPVGFAVEDFNPPEKRAYRGSSKLHLFSAGRMSDEKGFMYGLQALKLLVERGITDVTYSLTGEGYLRPQLERFVEQNELSKYIRFLGTLSTEEVLQGMLEADVLLLPSVEVGNWAENQACAVQEAMLMKALVVTTTTGGVPESIPDVMRKFSVPSRNPSALADTIARIRALPIDELAQLGNTGRQFVLEHYDIRRLNEHLIARTFEAHCLHQKKRDDKVALPTTAVA
jgi:colanic acid/amylovoran biosynthesis glycosyltransferase